MKHVLLALCMVIPFLGWTQQGSVSGKISDGAAKRDLSLATVTVFRAKDTAIITYRLSNENGDFKVPGLPLNIPLRLMVTYSGYDALRKEFTLTEKEPALYAGTLALETTSKQLDEVIVVAERPPVVIKRDTIEFNASAFKTLPSALLEDLLKKLPGVTVNENGDITVNGQKVNRLLVDGKRFFGDNPQIATRNLPSNMIDKVQVMDDKEQIDFNNDGDMSKIGKVINITLKKSIKKALFGRLYAGAGTSDRYEAGGILNAFRDTVQFSLLGFGNNINRASFSTKDITDMGGFSRSGWGNINGNSSAPGQQGFSVDGFSLGGTGLGLNSANGISGNLNHSPSVKVNFSFQYMYGTTKNELVQTQNTQRFSGNGNVNTRMLTTSLANGHTHNFASSGGWKPDSLTNMTFRIAYAYAGTWSAANTLVNTENSLIGPLNNGAGLLTTQGHTKNYSEVFTMSHRSRKVKGRALSVTQWITYGSNPLATITESNNDYQYPSAATVLFQQLRSTNAPSTYANLSVGYSTPIGTRFTLRLNPDLSYQKDEQVVMNYGKYVATKTYDSLNASLSSSLSREMTRGYAGGVLSYRINGVNINAGIGWLQQWVSNSFTAAVGNQQVRYANILPTFSVNWKRFSISYGQDVNPPGIRTLLPAPDNSNPFLIVYGNPLLAPSKRQSLNFNGTVVNPRANLNFYFSGRSSVTDNAVIQSVELNSSGIQLNKPINVDGLWSSSLDAGINKQYKSAIV